MNINLVAIDLAKNTFEIRGVNHSGKALIKKKVSRGLLMHTIRSFKPGTRVAMEACSGAHYWGREFQAAGYEVSLMAPQYVKPFVKSQKNDWSDAEGIAEAASRTSMRFIPVKSVEQQDILAIHRVRTRYVKQRTALMNELRGLLAEQGVVIGIGQAALKKHLPIVLELPTVSDRLKKITRELYQELEELEAKINGVTEELKVIADSLDVCKRLMTIPGIGEITATALYAAVGHMKFKNGRELAAFLGLIPRQNSTGGKQKLGRITKHGDRYIRTLLIHGARSVLQNSHRYSDRYSSWAMTMRETKGYAKGAVAVANRNARIACAIMNSDSSFDRDFAPAVTAQTLH